MHKTSNNGHFKWNQVKNHDPLEKRDWNPTGGETRESGYGGKMNLKRQVLSLDQKTTKNWQIAQSRPANPQLQTNYWEHLATQYSSGERHTKSQSVGGASATFPGIMGEQLNYCDSFLVGITNSDLYKLQMA